MLKTSWRVVLIRVLSPEAIRVMHLPPNDDAGGMGVPSMEHVVKAGVWLIAMRCRADMAKAMRFPHEKKVMTYITKYQIPQMQVMLDHVHRITTTAHQDMVGRAIQKTADEFLKDRTNPRTIRKRLMTVYNKNEMRQQGAQAHTHRMLLQCSTSDVSIVLCTTR